MLGRTSKPGHAPSGTASDGSTVLPFAEPKRTRTEWPAERLIILKELYDAGLSHLLIARALGMSKGAVGAKIDRLGWTRAETTLCAERIMPPRKPRPPKPVRTGPRKPLLNGQALKAGGNRADERAIRKFSWEQDA